MQIVTALKRLAYIDKPSKGDHVRLFKKVVGHPEGPITIQTGVDGKACGKSDIDRVQKNTKLEGEMWERAIKKKLPLEEYDEHLLAMPRSELVIEFFKPLVQGKVDGNAPASPAAPAKKAAKAKRAAKQPK